MNTYAIYGRGEQKEMTDLIPNILSELGPDSLANLRRMAESYQKTAAGQAALAADQDDDDDVPDLVESFEDVSAEESQEAKDATA